MRITHLYKVPGMLILCCYVLPSVSFAQDNQHFSKQILRLEEELDEFHTQIAQKEREMRGRVGRKNQELFKLKQRIRLSDSLTQEERSRLNHEVNTLTKSIRDDKARIIEIMSAVERKRKDIFVLKVSIDEWLIKVEATEMSIIDRIHAMRTDISRLIDKIDKEFGVAPVAKDTEK